MRLAIENLSIVQKDLNFRIDADFYSHSFRQKFLELKQQPRFSTLENETTYIGSGHTPYKHDVKYGDIPFITVECISDLEFFYNKTKRITSNHYVSEYKNKIIRKGAVVCTIKRRICKAYPFLSETQQLALNQDVALIYPKEKLLTGFLAVYLNCYFGQGFADSLKTEQMNPYISLVNLAKLPVPLLDLAFQKKIENIVLLSQQIKSKSECTYESANNTLLTDLGLTNWQPKHQLSFVKNYSDIQHSERIDAEYYQPKYEEIITAIKNYVGGWDTLDNLAHIKKCTEVGSGEYIDDGIPFVRVSNISQFEVSEEKYISESLYKSLTPQEQNTPFEKSKNHQPKQGEILFSKDGSPGIAYYIQDQPAKMIPSGGILRLKSKTNQVNNEYLTLVLNSILVQEQISRDVGGSIILHWRPDQVKETAIPILSREKQTQIQQKVTESFALRKQSKHLLESAKKAVEMAIEQDEQTALDWLELQTKDCQLDNE